MCPSILQSVLISLFLDDAPPYLNCCTSSSVLYAASFDSIRLSAQRSNNANPRCAQHFRSSPSFRGGDAMECRSDHFTGQMEAPIGDSTQAESSGGFLAGSKLGRRDPACSRPSSLCSTSSLGCHTSSCELSSSPASPARATTASDEACRSSLSLLQLPNSFLQNVLLLAGRDGGGLVTSCAFMRGLFHRLLATPPLAVRWMVELFGAAGAPDVVARIPLERYLQQPSRSDEASCAPTVATAPAGGTAAHHAAVKRIHMLGLLVVSGNLPRFSPDSAATLLRDACVVESPQAIQMVVRCAPTLSPAQAQPALLAATALGAAACVHELLSLTSVDPTAEGSLALRLASSAGSVACVEALLAAGAALERQHVAGFSPLDGLEGGVNSCLTEVGHSAEALAQAAAAAAAAGHAHVVGLLLRATRYPAALASLAAVAVAKGGSCSVGSTGSAEHAAGSAGAGHIGTAAGTASEAAAASGFSAEQALPAMRMLLAAGAEPSAFNGAMLLAACSRSQPPQQQHGSSGDNNLQCARASCSRTSSSNPLATSIATDHCAPADSGGLRPRACAADLVRELVAAGADPRAEDSMPLVTACRVGADVEVVQVLLAAGADAGAQDGAALRYACKHGAAEAVVELLAAAPGCHSLFGLATALAEAVAARHRGVAEALLVGCPAHGVEAQLVKDLALIQVAQVRTGACVCVGIGVLS